MTDCGGYVLTRGLGRGGFLEEAFMVVIRLARTGAKKRPFYHLVAADGRCRNTGRYIERLGFFNPLEKDQTKAMRIQVERVQHWLACGAQPSQRARQLLRQSGCLPV